MPTLPLKIANDSVLYVVSEYSLNHQVQLLKLRSSRRQEHLLQNSSPVLEENSPVPVLIAIIHRGRPCHHYRITVIVALRMQEPSRLGLDRFLVIECDTALDKFFKQALCAILSCGHPLNARNLIPSRIWVEELTLEDGHGLHCLILSDEFLRVPRLVCKQCQRHDGGRI